MILPRVLTALVGIPLVLFLVHVGSLPWLAFVLAATGLALFEYGAVLSAGRVQHQRWLLLATGMALAACVGLFPPSLDPVVRGRFPAMALTAVMAAALLRELFRKEHSWDRASVSAFGALFVAWPLAHLALIRNLRPHGRELTFTLLAVIWTADTAAWAAGTRWGRRRLAPQVSPHKTWEGLAAALAAGAACGAVADRVAAFGLGPAAAAGLGAGLALAAQLSDLCESMLKRRCGVKDSGALLPGHGGALDRLDPFYLAAPLYYYFWAFRLDG